LFKQLAEANCALALRLVHACKAWSVVAEHCLLLLLLFAIMRLL
jgi:hypothetical protein